jgi:hypothetical protein
MELKKLYIHFKDIFEKKIYKGESNMKCQNKKNKGSSKSKSYNLKELKELKELLDDKEIYKL